jgi:DNA (cytosine-5)-methyltransferase 1
MIVDLFAGAGGWDLGARHLGVNPIGLENDKWANATRAAAGLLTVSCDLLEHGPEMFPQGSVTGVIGSPPCQRFSMAGKRDGHTDPTARALLDTPMRWARYHCPAWIALEQVPPVLPYWKQYGRELQELGYSVWAGLVHAEQYGVPQTRKRAVLLASRLRDIAQPPPTHSLYYNRDPERLDANVLPWVSMAEALGWGFPQRPSPTVSGGGAATGGAEPFANATQRAALAQWTRRPAPTIVTSRRSDEGIIVGRKLPPGEERNIAHGGWTLKAMMGRPATMSGDSRLSALEHHERQQNNAVRITVADASILQSFPADYPWQGVNTRKFLQIGNAVPPQLAYHLLKAVI